MPRNIPHSEETKKRISNSMKGIKRNDNFKEKIRQYRLKHPISSKYWKGKKFSKEHIEKLRISHTGSRSSQWKGGVTPLVNKIRNSIEYKLWRKSVFERDNYTCVWCGTKKAPFNADHIKPFCDYPELRLAIDNGRTLCVDCHKKTSTYLHKGNKIL